MSCSEVFLCSSATSAEGIRVGDISSFFSYVIGSVMGVQQFNQKVFGELFCETGPSLSSGATAAWRPGQGDLALSLLHRGRGCLSAPVLPHRCCPGLSGEAGPQASLALTAAKQSPGRVYRCPCSRGGVAPGHCCGSQASVSPAPLLAQPRPGLELYPGLSQGLPFV